MLKAVSVQSEGMSPTRRIETKTGWPSTCFSLDADKLIIVNHIRSQHSGGPSARKELKHAIESDRKEYLR
jgi:hypothetical protein